ncbi:MAG: hypothetical protein H6502_01060 [Candidatus Woesearchaeota archaeon]|nr:MAG: hypothetical protein H6502_01060 [Candidatus Woesearchaeota archaeon]
MVHRKPAGPKGLGLVVILFTLFFLVAVIPFTTSISVNPQETIIERIDQENIIRISIINNDVEVQNIQLQTSQESKYLDRHFSINPTLFGLSPGETKVIEVQPTDLLSVTPEKHHFSLLVISVDEENQEQTISGAITIYFTKEGDQQPSLHFDKLTVVSSSPEEIVYSVDLLNNGNINDWIKPRVSLFDESRNEVFSTTYKKPFLLEPSQSTTLTLPQQFSRLERGTYTLRVQMIYNENLSSPLREAQITINQERARTTEGNDYSIPLVISLGVLGLLGFILYRYREYIKIKEELEKKHSNKEGTNTKKK